VIYPKASTNPTCRHLDACFVAVTASVIMTRSDERFQRTIEMRTTTPVTPAIWLVAVAAFVPFCADANNNPNTSANIEPNDFPTLARVEYVLRCMDYHGGQVYENMYSCVCSIDRIATEFRYDEFLRAEVLAQLRTTPGERGGLFREGGRELIEKYLAVTEAAENSCFSSAEPA